MKTAIFLVTAIAVRITAAITSSTTPTHAQQGQGVNNGNSPCIDRGFTTSDNNCLPGQHVNTQGQGLSNDHVGNPHYPQINGPRTGDPHGKTVCNPQTGNPHADRSFC